MHVFDPLYSMLYTVNLGLHDCVGVSQIQSHISQIELHYGTGFGPLVEKSAF